MKHRYLMAILLMAVMTLSTLLQAQQNHTLAEQENPETRTIIELEITDAIGPATSDYIERSLDKVSVLSAMCVLIRIDTPGGLDTSMRQIIKKIIAAPVPVISYVAPGGARAASAGTYILYASHIAAMAPGTNLGAATPVQLINPDNFESEKPAQHDQDTSDQQADPVPVIDDPLGHKMVNDAVAYIRGLAKLRGRNADWAEQAVRKAASLPAEEALQLNVIDMIAVDRAELLRKLNGRKVNVLGQEVTLTTEGAVVEKREPDWRSKLLAVITNPNIAYILMLVGIYGLILEFSNPGAIVPGTVGGICLLLALFAFQVLPVNYAGMALIILGVALMIAEAFVPSFGILGLGGVLAFVIGSIILMDTEAPGFGINPSLIVAFALSSVAFILLILGMLLKSRNKPVVSGKEELIGKIGIAMEDFSDTGMLHIHSENWRAYTDGNLRKNDKARVKGLEGLTLLVTPLNKEEYE